jgi:hypothetical protein
MNPSPLRYESIRHTFIRGHYVTPLNCGRVHFISLDPYLTIAIASFPASKVSYRVPSTVTSTQK